MEVLKRSAHGYAQDPTKNLDFGRFEGCGNPDVALIVAAFERTAGCWKQFALSDVEIDRIKKKKVVRLEFEEPNKFFINENFDSYDYDFYKVLTLCPYTATYLNRLQGELRRVPIFFPFNYSHTPIITEKKYDVIYTGHIVSQHVLKDLKTISRFNYRLVSNSKHALVTNRGVDYNEKLTLISQSRITLVHNLLYPTFRHLRNIWNYPEWQNNLAFSELPPPWRMARFFTNRSAMVVPQLKSRAFEAAFSRSLILCKRDPFNIIEKYFEPEKEFIYFDEGCLSEAVARILQSYGDYQPVIDRAFERAKKEYTTDAFFHKFLRDIK